jgi:uncharacterized protein YeeX (DUF496 family)
MKLSLIALLFLGLSSTLMSQDYSKEWQEVEAFQQKRLPKSAFEKANAIFEKALIANNQEQIVKSIFYLQNLSSQLEEIEYDSRIQKEIKFVEKNLDKVTGGAKSLVISFLAEKYSQFLDQNYWKIKDRTKNTGSRAEDLALWTMEDLENKSKELYLASVENELTKKIKIEEFKQLISNTNSKYCQTLYDFLARRAIQALSNERHYISEPVHSFQPTADHFSALPSFLKNPIIVQENSSKKYLALEFYQKLLKEHINDAEPTILIDLELQRLSFVYNNYSGDDKDAIYKKNLKALFEQYKNYSESYEALLTLAGVVRNEGTNYTNSKDTAYQWRNKDAIAICERIIAECKDASLVAQARNLMNGIKDNIHFSPILEKVYLPGKPILAHLNYSNMDKIYYRIYPKQVDMDHLYEYYNDQKDYFKKVFKQPVIQQGNFSLKQPGDYFGHTTELDLPPLANGLYTIIFSKEPSFDFSENLMHGISISVSNLAYFIHKEPTKANIDLYTLDRTLGHPQSQVEVQLYQSFWTNRKQAKLILPLLLI